MKKDIRGPLFATVLLLALGFGIYWGAAVVPAKRKFWTTVRLVTDVSGARIEMDGQTVALEKGDAARIFDSVRLSRDYSPNHPVTLRKGAITFDTNEGKIAFSIVDTDNQGVLLWAFSSGDAGWSYGIRSCDEIRDHLPIRRSQKAENVAIAGAEGSPVALIKKYAELPAVDISSRHAWQNPIWSSEKHRFAKAMAGRIRLSEVKDQVTKLTPGDKYILFEALWPSANKQDLDVIIAAAKATSPDVEKDQTFSQSVQTDIVSFAAGIVENQQKQEKSARWLSDVEIAEYRKELEKLGAKRPGWD